MARPKKAPPVEVKAPAKVGRPAFAPTEQMRASVTIMVAAGILQDAISGSLGISSETLRKYFAEEIEHGSTRTNERVVAKHLELVDKGDFQAVKFWEQARMGWSDKTTLVDDRPPQTRVVIELVGSPPPGEKTIDHAPTDRGGALRNAIEFVGEK